MKTAKTKMKRRAWAVLSALLATAAFVFVVGCEKPDEDVGDEGGDAPDGIVTITDSFEAGSAPGGVPGVGGDPNITGGQIPPPATLGDQTGFATDPPYPTVTNNGTTRQPYGTTVPPETVDTFTGGTSDIFAPTDPINPIDPADPTGFATAATETPPASPSATDANANGVAAAAVSLIGTPFVANGSTPQGFDNSGFIYYVLRNNGFATCPRNTSGQKNMGQSVTDVSQLTPGDLVFFSNEPGGDTAIGGIYIGNNKMIFAPYEGEVVREVDMNQAYWRSVFHHGVALR